MYERTIRRCFTSTRSDTMPHITDMNDVSTSYKLHANHIRAGTCHTYS